MAWNEPGNNRKDPWGGRNSQEGPPDLDEVLKKLKEQFFGQLGSSGGSGSSSNAPLQTAGLVAAVGFIIWGLTGIYLVDEGSRGVVTRFGEYSDTTMPGLHWHLPAPIEKVDVVNIEQQRFVEIGYRSSGRQQNLGSVPKEALMLTQDENIIDIRLAVQYQIKDAAEYLFNVADPEGTLKAVIESAQRAVIGKNTMDFVLTEGRGRVADEIKAEIQQTLDQYKIGIHVTNVSLVDAQPPEEVQNAFEDAIKAREDEQRLKNEAESYANEVVPKARGTAARMMEESEAYRQRAISKAEGEASRFKQLLTEYEKAPEVTRERMYLDAMQDIFEQTDTIVMDVKGSNNVVYLPLDKVKRQSSSAAVHSAKEVDTPVQGVTSQDVAEIVNRSQRTSGGRGREGRGQ